MRWLALGVDYEMSGKTSSLGRFVDQIVRSWAASPQTLDYELFLDEQARRFQIEGNGLSVDEWLAYGRRKVCRSSCSRKPRAASGSIRRDPPGGDDISPSSRNITKRKRAGGGARDPVWSFMPASRP